MRITRRTRIVLAVVGLVLLVACVSFGPLVRRRAASEAARRGLTLAIGGVRPGFFAVRLLDVAVAPEGVPGASAQLDEVEIELSASLSPQRVRAVGGKVRLSGAPDLLVDELRSWRDAHRATGSSSAGGRTILEATALSVEWSKLDGVHDDASASVSGGVFRRDGDGSHLGFEAMDAAVAGFSAHVGSFSADLDADNGFRAAHGASATLGFSLPEPSAGARDPAPDLSPPPAPVAARTKAPKTMPFRSPFEWPDLRGTRAKIRAAVERFGPRFPDGASADVDELTVAVSRGKDSITVGPGRAALGRSVDELTADFAPGQGSSSSTPLSLHASVPVSHGDVVVSLSGGPVSLELLGVKEGAMGLADTQRGTLGGKARITLDDAGGSVVFDVDVSAKDLAVLQPKIAKDVVRGISLRTMARGTLDADGHLRLDDGELQFGALHLRGRGTVEQSPEHLAANLTFDLPVAACQSLLESVPAALVPHLAGARFKGTLAARGLVAFDTRKIDDLLLKYDFDDLCEMVVVPPDLKKERFGGRFTHAIVTKDGEVDARTTGPGEEDWAAIDDISPFMQVAVLTTEDGAFFHHRGFNHAAIRSSIIANLKAGRFVRGASTITMQLAKNLFLSREKTVSRKLEEVILATYLERTFRKEELMELYLNVIEFGPDVYGVRAAAMHYFGRRPEELNLAESLFLSSLLPRPREYHKIWEKGELPASWVRNIHQLMDVAEKNGKISRKELEEGMTETVLFHKEGDPPPAPRPPITGAHLTGGDDWEPVE